MNENKYLQDFFNKKYADSIGNSNFYIAFEDCGFHISKETFNDPISQQYSKNVQVEALSNDCDYVVPVCDTILGHSASSISNYIELLKDSIHFNEQKFEDDPGDMMSFFGNEKSKLTRQFVSCASTINPNGSYYQSILNPDGFLDDANKDIWTPYSESWSFPSTNTTNSNLGIWKIRPELLKTIQKFRMPVTGNTAPQTASAAVAHETAATINPPPKTISTVIIDPQRVASGTQESSGGPLRTNRVATMPDQPATGNIATAGATPPKVPPIRTMFNRDILVQRFLTAAHPDEKADVPVKTSSVNIFFRFCIAHIDRPWFYKNILDINQSWYCTGLTEGFFSTGEMSESNTGKLPSLPVSMILVKDLSITAVFNAGDWENAKKAVALDSLNIAEADFKDLGNNNHAIESAGVQIIGWICEYLPKFPVCADPSLESPPPG